MGAISNKKFEDALRDLEEIVERLETGELSLDEALGAFEQGVALVRYLGEKLTEVEKRIEVLTREPGGMFQLQSVTEDEDDDE